MKKIFITIPWFLPAFRAGGPVQSIANLIKEYADNVEYRIFCSDVDLNGAALQDITTDTWIQFNHCTKVWYTSPSGISNKLVTEIEIFKPDIIYIIGLYNWHFNMVPLLFCKAPRKILSVRGMLHPGALSQKKWKKKVYLSLFRLLEIQHKVTFHATDNEEKNYIQQHFGKKALVCIAGNFPNTIGRLTSPVKTAESLNLVSIALISPMKNILLVLEALDTINVKIQYDIYGPVKDAAYWEQCKLVIKKMPQNIVVNYYHEIQPAEIRSALEQAHIFILPSKSENFGHAIYEALSAGKPVITSYHTPWNDLQASQAGINSNLNIDDLKNAILFFAKKNDEEMQQWQASSVNYSLSKVNNTTLKKEYHRMLSTETNYNL